MASLASFEHSFGKAGTFRSQQRVGALKVGVNLCQEEIGMFFQPTLLGGGKAEFTLAGVDFRREQRLQALPNTSLPNAVAKFEIGRCGEEEINDSEVKEGRSAFDSAGHGAAVFVPQKYG
jgi:hypothetical protein